MYLVGLTGGIATGKSTVTEILQEMGIKVIDADKIAREVVEPGTAAWKKIRSAFGVGIFTPTGELDRIELGKIIFSNPEERNKLNAITHPEIYKTIFWQCINMLIRGYQFVVLDLPLLYESGKMVPYMTKVIVVTCDNEQQLTRLTNRNNLSVEDAEARISAQMPLEDKCYRADFVIDNSGTVDVTKRQVEVVVMTLRRSYAHWKLRILFWGGLGCVVYGASHFIRKFLKI